MSDGRPLTARQVALLDALYPLRDRWARPMDLGGKDASHHSATLAQLHARGLTDRTTRRGIVIGRSSYVYRISAKGIAERARLRKGGER